MTKFLTEDEIVSTVFDNMGDISISNIKELKDPSEMIQFHHSDGRQIRNMFELWDPNNPLTNSWFVACDTDTNEFLENGVDNHPNHPDAVSFRILVKIWEKVHES